MKPIAIARVIALVVLAGGLLVGAAEARNPHCAGGIQYVVQAMRDKEKGNTEDYVREINKAVQQLQICMQEDPADFEAAGYLGWAYAEVDSMCLAGTAFETAVKGLQTKGDVKKVDWATNNRNSYWAQAFNKGIAKIGEAQAAYPDFCKQPANDADKTAKNVADQNYREAASNLGSAMCLKPGDMLSIRNLASVHALTCDYPRAEATLRDGLKLAPGDTSLTAALRMVRVNYANQLADQKKYDEAITFFSELLKTEPGNADLHLSVADVLFRRAQGAEGETRKKDFIAAGEGYSKAFELKPTEADLSFNAAVAFQNAQLWDKAEAMWAKTCQIRSTDVEALSSWGACLVELKRCPEAITTVHKAVGMKPQDRTLHRQLGAIYTKCGNNARGTDELMVYLAMQNGQAVPDAGAQAKQAKQGSDAAKTLASEGVPEHVYLWEADNQKYETWFYWAKNRAFAFSGGTITRKSDWSSADTKPAPK